MYGYAMPPFDECYTRHGPRMTTVDHPLDHSMTSDYTPDMLSSYPDFWSKEPEPWTSSVVQWSKDDKSGMDMLDKYQVNHIRGIYSNPNQAKEPCT